MAHHGLAPLRNALKTAKPSAVRRIEAEFVRPHRWVLLLALIGMVAQSALLLPIPILQGRVVDGLLASGDNAAIGPAIAVAVGCILLRAGLAWRVGATMVRVSLEVVRDLTARLHEKLMLGSASALGREPTGSTMARVTNDVGSLLIFLSSGTLQLASDLVLAVGIAVVLLAIDIPLAVVAFLVVAVLVGNRSWFAKRAGERSEAVRQRLGLLYDHLGDRVASLRIVQAFAQGDREVRDFANRLDDHESAAVAELTATVRQTAISAAVSGLGIVLILVVGAVRVSGGHLTAGQLVAVYTLVGLLFNPLVRLTQLQAMWSATRVAIDRMVEVLDRHTDPASEGKEALAPGPGQLRLDNLSVRAVPDGPPVLHGLRATIEAGTTVGLVGPTGSGKSLLLAVLARLHDPACQAGRATLDGQVLPAIRFADVRVAVTLVPQTAVVFAGTIRGNVTYGRPGASESAIRRAIEAAELADFVDALPDGLDTHVGPRGNTLSGGQRQRLALARALLMEPRVLLLDDSTSALDAETEARILDNLAYFWPNQTRVVASSKPSALAAVDALMVLEGGEMVYHGPPADWLTGRPPNPGADRFAAAP